MISTCIEAWNSRQNFLRKQTRTHNVFVKAFLLLSTDFSLCLLQQLLLQCLLLFRTRSLRLRKDFHSIGIILLNRLILSGDCFVLTLPWNKFGHDDNIHQLRECARRARNFGGDSGTLVAKAVAESTSAASLHLILCPTTLTYLYAGQQLTIHDKVSSKRQSNLSEYNFYVFQVKASRRL